MSIRHSAFSWFHSNLFNYFICVSDSVLLFYLFIWLSDSIESVFQFVFFVQKKVETEAAAAKSRTYRITFIFLLISLCADRNQVSAIRSNVRAYMCSCVHCWLLITLYSIRFDRSPVHFERLICANKCMLFGNWFSAVPCEVTLNSIITSFDRTFNDYVN